MLVQKKFLFKKTFLDMPLFLFLASQILSTIFSIDRHTSFFGYYSRFNGGLLSTACYLLLYWAFIANNEAKDVYRVLKASLISALIITIYGILEHFGHSFSCLMFQGTFDTSCWVQKVQERVFATLGQPNWLAAYLAILIPLSWAKLFNQKKKIFIAYYLLLATGYFLCLIFTGSRSGFLGFLVSAAVFWFATIFLNKSNLKAFFKPLILTSFFLILSVVVFGSPIEQINKILYYKSFSAQTSLASTSAPVLSEDGGISTSSDIRKIVWRGAIAIFKHYPLFGSGVETFAYSYYNFRPLEHNLVSEWDFLYNKAHNEYLNYLSTTGVFGLGTYLLFIIAFVFWNIRQFSILNFKFPINDQNIKFLNIALFSGWLTILITNFFGFSVVVTSLYFFLIPAFLVTLSTPILPTNQKPTTANKLSFAPLILTSLYLILFVVNYWRADFFYAMGEKFSKQNAYADAYGQFYRAKNLFKNEPVYLSEISSVTANLSLLSNSPEQENTTSELISLAESYSNQALKISPRNLNVLKTRIRVYYTLSVFDQKYLQKAIETIQEAIKLAPTDPKLVYNLGLLYAKTGEADLTIKTIEKAIVLKLNYIDARNALVLFYEDTDQKDLAIEQLKILMKLAPANKEAFQKKLDKLQGK